MDVPAVKWADLEVRVAKVLINLGSEGSVDIHENPALHCIGILSPVVVVVLLVVTAFTILSSRRSFPESCPSFASFTKRKTYPIIANFLKVT